MMPGSLEGSRVEYDGYLWALHDIDFITGRALLTRCLVPMEKYRTELVHVAAINWPS
ncbi:hypothetical protein SEA_GAIL_41 [Mycobacterium phage Gail]|uniref:Uncharacterized protein n=1 Tax=Mycobacterium phage Gail TaxID=2743994 RepID=A0A7D5FS71_9CAUD|nr:hypothetical protein KNV16_gp068 [Mycobacterium phage Gail]QLF84605.1 hypothetical protein SEA_GAIL_41 [Mycobacterium phage Gail]